MLQYLREIPFVDNEWKLESGSVLFGKGSEFIAFFPFRASFNFHALGREIQIDNLLISEIDVESRLFRSSRGKYSILSHYMISIIHNPRSRQDACLMSIMFVKFKLFSSLSHLKVARVEQRYFPFVRHIIPPISLHSSWIEMIIFPLKRWTLFSCLFLARFISRNTQNKKK